MKPTDRWSLSVACDYSNEYVNDDLNFLQLNCV